MPMRAQPRSGVANAKAAVDQHAGRARFDDEAVAFAAAADATRNARRLSPPRRNACGAPLT